MQIITRVSLGIILSLCTHLLFAQSSSSDNQELSEAELEQMLAPIALYPDTVLAHVLIAATYPLEVVQAERWSNKNSSLSAEQALQAVEDEDWDPSVKALVPFPDLLKRMSDDLDWTQRLGDAFLLSEERVMASVQSLRQRAYDEGNLSSLKNVDVSRDKEVIIIEPSVREVIYIPYYDTRYVYGNWHWSHYPPVYWHSTYIGRRSHRVYWGPRISVSVGFFFSSFRWHQHHVVVVDHHHHRDSNHRFYNGRHVARHESARHWEHNPHHRRGVVYRNPRTRDYFESRKRSSSSARQNSTRRDYVPRQEFNEQRREQVKRNIRQPRKTDNRVRAKDRSDNSAAIEQRKQKFEKQKNNKRGIVERQQIKTDRNQDSSNRKRSNERSGERQKASRQQAVQQQDVRQQEARQNQARQISQQRAAAKKNSQDPRMRNQQESRERVQRQETKSRFKRSAPSAANRQNNNRAVRTERKERSANYRVKRER